ncbi:hypothetical protein B9G39_28845 [Zooshikella ganghwensis]|uniref:Uncharacterized protein n=1 Tax=Zooshikella ganghwensis TaxID=202772 RepID=A0A4V1IMS8_9GAMM|nr:hypothetical protein B9G39_28845 [Zooshikella ganghwensis]
MCQYNFLSLIKAWSIVPLAALIATLGSAFLSIMVFTIYLNYWFEITVLPIVSFFLSYVVDLLHQKVKY